MAEMNCAGCGLVIAQLVALDVSADYAQSEDEQPLDVRQDDAGAYVICKHCGAQNALLRTISAAGLAVYSIQGLRHDGDGSA